MKDTKVEFPNPCSEPWDAISPRGCNRHCASCDKIIHDLTSLTFKEPATLLEHGDEVCVRAKVGPNGMIELMDSGRRTAQRLLAAANASHALAAAACQTVPDASEPRFQITGKFA